jgi:ATP-dependent Clp protease ATP-binding subunit ClpC
VKKIILDKGYDSQNGARPLRRAIQDEVEHAIAEGIIAGEYHKGDILKMVSKRGTLAVEVEREGELSERAATAK